MKRPKIRLGIHSADPDQSQIWLYGRALVDTPENRERLRAVVLRYNELTEGNGSIVWNLGVFQVSGKRVLSA